jgi:hypothetical protein
MAWNERIGAKWDSFSWRYVVPIVAVIMIGLVITQLPSAYRARFTSDGIPGTFTVVSVDCTLGLKCSASGFFISDDDSVLLDNVGWGGSARGLNVDDDVPAVDTGNDAAVYPPQSGGGDWLFYSWAAFVAAVTLIGWVAWAARRLLRRRLGGETR